ncbi:MAG TPA: hypothetical protein VFK44_09680 [Bacillales bacterium]|nr:hypothetical protein [Bacillales bacterium]
MNVTQRTIKIGRTADRKVGMRRRDNEERLAFICMAFFIPVFGLIPAVYVMLSTIRSGNPRSAKAQLAYPCAALTLCLNGIPVLFLFAVLLAFHR